MIKHSINLFDSAFAGQSCSVFGKEARLVDYVRGMQRFDGITIFTDQWIYDPLVEQVDCSLKVGWLIEGKELRPWYYRDIMQVAHLFDFILTYDQSLIEQDPHKFRLAVKGGVWTPRDEWGLYKKTKEIAMIVSDKHETSGHKLRHEIVKQIPTGIDYFGPQFTPIGTNKRIAYQEYRYAVIVEAERSTNFFSEHLLDAIAYGCTPIYWGCPNLATFFGLYGTRNIYGVPTGIIGFHDVVSLKSVIQYVNGSNRCRYSISNLQQYLDTYEITDDWLVLHPLKPYLGGDRL